MGKYLKTRKEEGLFSRFGLLEVCLYLVFSFPGIMHSWTTLAQRIVLLLLTVQSTVLIIFHIKDKKYLSWHTCWYVLFLAFSFLSLIISAGELANADFYSMIICLFLSVFFSLYIKNTRSFKMVCWCYVVTSAINSLVLFFNGYLRLQAGERLGTNIGINPNFLATFLMYSAVYALWLILYETRLWERVLLLALLLMIMYPLSLTGGRKYLLAPIIFIIIAVLINNDRVGNISKKLVVIFCLVLSVYLIIMSVPSIYNSLGVRLEQLFNSITGHGEVDMSTLVRKDLRKLALRGWLESPIWGHGFDRFKYYSLVNGKGFGYSHSNITELLFNEGIIGLLIYYGFYFLVLWKGIRDSYLNSSFRVFCISGLITQLFYDYGGVSYNLFHSQLFITMTFFASLLMKSEKGVIDVNYR